jgi:antitoxin CptB
VLSSLPIAVISSAAYSKLRWRSRRGMLENDLFIERFFAKYENTLTVNDEAGMIELMNLSDNDLLDLLLSRKGLIDIEIENNPHVEAVLKKLKEK